MQVPESVHNIAHFVARSLGLTLAEVYELWVTTIVSETGAEKMVDASRIMINVLGAGGNERFAGFNQEEASDGS